MSFKLRSEIVLYKYSSRDVKEGGHVIIAREKRLRNGWVVRIKASEYADVEGKSWRDVEGKVRIVDDNTLGVSWRADLPGCLRVFFPENYKTWSSEELIKSEVPYQYGTSIYDFDPAHRHNFNFGSLPEIFTALDRLKANQLIQKGFETFKDVDSVDWKTTLVYEPTLPPQAKR